MAVVFLALNGDGLGHLVRTSIVCRALASVGEHPLIFSQGILPLDERFRFPGKRIPSLWKASSAVRHVAAAELRFMTQISQPSILVEDTHPSPLSLPPNIRRVLLVRPTFFEHLRMLKEKYGRVFSRFLLCDFPHSPTWPYSTAETAEILAWGRWHIVGPIYRAPSAVDIVEVRQRYRITGEQRVCIFSMGGGGRHLPDDKDAERFVDLAEDIAEQLRSRGGGVRLIFVQGPYFPAEVKIASQFEVIAREPRMPALLAAADGAVIRAGFNTPWECIAGGTPFWPFIGTTVNEPVAVRVGEMRAAGLLPDNVGQFWHDEEWRARFRRSCRSLVDKYSGEPDARLFQKLIIGRMGSGPAPDTEHRAKAGSASLADTAHSRASGSRTLVPLAIRIDEVASREAALAWLLTELAARGLRASLEVVPYLVDFDDSFLDRYDPAGLLFEIAQHGYAGVPHSVGGRKWHEFSMENDAPSDSEIAEITLGRQRLQEAFPTRWRGGFSPSFDAMPSWLPSLWRNCGGVFVSRIAETQATDFPLPVFQAGTDAWDWSWAKIRPPRHIGRELTQQARRNGHAGIVLRVRFLRFRHARAQLIKVLDFLRTRDFATASLNDIAARRFQ